MKTLGYYNGEYGEIEDMKIPMTDRVTNRRATSTR